LGSIVAEAEKNRIYSIGKTTQCLLLICILSFMYGDIACNLYKSVCGCGCVIIYILLF